MIRKNSFEYFLESTNFFRVGPNQMSYVLDDDIFVYVIVNIRKLVNINIHQLLEVNVQKIIINYYKIIV